MTTEPTVIRTDGVPCTHRCTGCGYVVAPACPICAEQLPVDSPPEVWFEVPLNADWVAAYRVMPDSDDAWVVGEVRVFPAEPGRSSSRPGRWSAERLGTHAPVPAGGLTTRTLRQAKIAEHLGTLMPEIINTARRRRPDGEVDRRLAEAGLPRPVSGRREARSDLQLALLAEEYVELLKQGERAPIRTLAHSRGRSELTVRDLIAEARERKLLTRPPAPGRPGGSLTETANALLHQRDQAAHEARRDAK